MIPYLAVNSFASVAIEALAMLLVFLTPFAIFALLIHSFERITQQALAERFGWHAVLWTGWLGTPIHELSHAFACWLFNHRVDEVALFEPDPESGRLGYVRHSYRKENWFENFGNLFIGIAPLIGGSVVLAFLLWLFYPEAAIGGLRTRVSSDVGTVTGLVRQAMDLAIQIGREIFLPQHLLTIRFWLFLYLVLCVGSHMAPSASDYRGASQGAWIAGAALLAVAFLLALIGVPVNTAMQSFVTAAGPMFAILSLTCLLCGLVALLVYLGTSFFRKKYRLTG